MPSPPRRYHPYAPSGNNPASHKETPPKTERPSSPSPSPRKARAKLPGSGRPWTPGEKIQLLHFALERNGRGWDQAVPGRTGTQASQTWKMTVLPFLERALEGK